MKPLWCIITLLCVLAAYKLGYHYGQAAGNATAAKHQKLYEQAIQNQIIECNDITHITPNIKLKEKQP